MPNALRRIAIIQGHPDPAGGHLCHALADAYVSGAISAGHEIRRTEVARLDFSLLRTEAEFESGTLPPTLAEAQQAISWADHIVIVFPLWLGSAPALLKGFLEQIMRPGFAFEYRPIGFPKTLLGNKSARLVVTMGMPSLVFRWYFGAFGTRFIERSILGFAGVKPVRQTMFGMVATAKEEQRRRWFEDMVRYGRAGD
jgi:putative NADPH-quinone reductase